jgi:hypothetical protein
MRKHTKIVLLRLWKGTSALRRSQNIFRDGRYAKIESHFSHTMNDDTQIRQACQACQACQAFIHILTEENARLSAENAKNAHLSATLNAIIRDTEFLDGMGIAPCCVCDTETFWCFDDDEPELRVNCMCCSGDCGVQIYCKMCYADAFGEDMDPQYCHVHRDEYE